MFRQPSQLRRAWLWGKVSHIQWRIAWAEVRALALQPRQEYSASNSLASVSLPAGKENTMRHPACMPSPPRRRA